MKNSMFYLFLLLFPFAMSAQATNDAFEVDIRGTGSPLILIPGLACSGEVWQATVDSLQQMHTCHTLTLAGFGDQAAMPFDEAYLPQVKNALKHYIQQELKEDPVIIGHSLGGFLGLWVASELPHEVNSLVIVDAYPFYTQAINPAATESSAQPQAKLMQQMMLTTPDSLFRQQQQMTMNIMLSEPADRLKALEWSLQSDRKTVAQAMYELMTTDLREEVAEVNCPIMVLGSWIAGKDYGISPSSTFANFEQQYALADSCTIKIAATARHFIMLDAPEWFHAQLRDFIQ
ncbi:MAG: alpha/beta hydrolase [Bacteroidota bacterium]